MTARPLASRDSQQPAVEKSGQRQWLGGLGVWYTLDTLEMVVILRNGRFGTEVGVTANKGFSLASFFSLRYDWIGWDCPRWTDTKMLGSGALRSLLSAQKLFIFQYNNYYAEGKNSSGRCRVTIVSDRVEDL